MKKFFITLFFILFLTTGCVRTDENDFDAILKEGTSSKLNLVNVNRSGYKYYTPKGVGVTTKDQYNEVLHSGDYIYYLYVDVVSYYNRVVEKYTPRENVYYATAISYKDKFGYLEIKNVGDDKYLIEIMYNYAKIEVIVREKDLGCTVANAISILSSIEYNKEIIGNMMGENILEFHEKELNIFETKPNKDSSLLQYDEDDTDEEEDKDYTDPDLIH